MKGTRYRLTFIEANVPPLDPNAELYVLLDDEIFPKQGERWSPMIQEGRSIIRMQTVAVDSVDEVSPGTYNLKVAWLDDHGEIDQRWNPTTGLYLPMAGTLRLERAEDG